MIRELVLENFRGFEKHVVPLHTTTVIVGKNNAGKSTIVEALRLISLVTTRYKALNFSPVPNWLELPLSVRGVSPSLKNMEIDLDTAFHRYGSPPATVKAEFLTGESVEVNIGSGAVFGVIKTASGKVVTNKAEAARLDLPSVSILPQVAPVSKVEHLLDADYVRGAAASSLAPLHFRNQLTIMRDNFSTFKVLAEESWPGLRIRELRSEGKRPDPVRLTLLVQDGDFPAEIGWMGHGLQMWLQTIWFLSRTVENSTIVLDEPDVYMHADLQRRLVRMVRGRYSQVVIATHSSEIMAEVEPDNILIVNKAEPASVFASTLPAAQEMLESLGSVHNLQLTRLWNARRFIIREGKDDLAYLKRFQNTLFPESETPIDILPGMKVDGWGGWNLAMKTAAVLREAAGEGMRIYCIFDSDYHTPEEIQSRVDEARQKGVDLNIWKRKEIENYLLDPRTIQRLISMNVRAGEKPPTTAEVAQKIDSIAVSLQQDTFDAAATAIQSQNRGMTVGTANKKARELLDAAWETPEGRISVVCGKTVIRRLSEWAQSQWKVSLNSGRISFEMRKEEIPDELKNVLTAIELGTRFK